jgi:hypothetical protein
MKAELQPTYKKFQTDIERYIISLGKCEKSKDGMRTFWGYDDALSQMFGLYLEQSALEPLVEHFRRWNWERSYNQYLHDLTSALVAKRDWTLIQRLWEGVIAKRRKLYNDIWKIEKDSPGTLPATHLPESKERLLETLAQLQEFAKTFGAPGEAQKYIEMAVRIENGKRA